jgi:SAM-dependent methyltransferase
MVTQAHPASVRNAEPILAVLRRVLPPQGRVLEIASGSGYHAATFAAGLPGLTWQPSDLDPTNIESIAAYVAAARLANLRMPLVLDVTQRPWPPTDADALVCINMIHIAPWAATEGLFAGAGEVLAGGGVLFTYGPYILRGDFLAESNVAFDASLRARNPTWGLREVDDVAALAERHGFALPEIVPMPANNLSLVFRKK